MASLFFACEEKNDRQIEKSCDSEDVEVSATNPNGDSELALLMRKMYRDADSIKQLIVNQEGSITNEFIAELELVHSAIPTDSTVKTPEFEAFNRLLINQAKELQKNSEDNVEEFNRLVNRCIDCHQSFCPGPIKKINKLRIINPIN